MIEGCEDSCFALEAGEAFGIVRQCRRENLDRDFRRRVWRASQTSPMPRRQLLEFFAAMDTDRAYFRNASRAHKVLMKAMMVNPRMSEEAAYLEACRIMGYVLDGRPHRLKSLAEQA